MSWTTYTVGYVFSTFAFSGAETIIHELVELHRLLRLLHGRLLLG